MFFAKATITAGLIAAVNAHIKMVEPKPYAGDFTNGPLEPSGSNFPCKFDGAYPTAGGSATTYELGSKQEMSFMGSAVHGGGSCQISITYDDPPTKDSVWKVIHSIEGGCPARKTAGNLSPSDANLMDPDKYPYTIPSDIPAGKASISFSWANAVGNREFYMNCAPVELSGTGGDKANYEKLPDMVVLNIMGKPTVPEGSDVMYADPGSSVENNLYQGSFSAAKCDGISDCTSATQEEAASSGSGSGSDSGSDSGSATTTAAAEPTTTAAAGSTEGGVFLTVNPSGDSGATATAPATETAAATEAPAATTPAAVPTTLVTSPAASATGSAGSDSGSSSGSTGAKTGACDTEGTWNCVGDSFQQCASGTWSVLQPMAAGTSCTAGTGTEMKIVAARGMKGFSRVFRA